MKLRIMSHGSVVSAASCLRAGKQTRRGPVPGRKNVQTGPETPPSLLFNDYYAGIKVARV